ncbi:MAG: GntR family transcriptional regulator [Gemmobacter sp.]
MLQTDPFLLQAPNADQSRVLPPLERFQGSLAQRVYGALKDAILTLALRPGEMLRKPEICAGLGISRSPVAEAVARLAAEGLVDVVPQAGSFVARFSMEEIREGAFLREALEVATIAHLAPAIAEETLVLLRRNLRLQEVLVADGDIAGFYEQDAQMHAMILAASGFRRIAALSETAWVHVNRARRLVLPRPGRVAAPRGAPRAILAALAARAGARAAAALRAHLGRRVPILEPLTETHPGLFARP